MKYKTLILALLLFTTALIAQVDDPSLVAHYKLSRANYNADQNTFTDLSGNGNHAVPADTFQFVADHLGNSDGAMRFDGKKDFLNCGNSRDFNLTDEDKTILIWLKPNLPYTEKSAYFSFFYKYDDNNNFFSYNFKNHKSRGLYIKNKGVVSRNNHGEKRTFSNNQYHLFTLIYKHDEEKIYIYHNAHPNDMFSTSDDVSMENNGDFVIGNIDYYDRWGGYRGAIEEFLVYSKALNKDEIESVYNYYRPEFIDWNFELGKLSHEVDSMDIVGVPFYIKSSSEAGVSLYEYKEPGIKPFSGNFCSKHTVWPGYPRSMMYEGYGSTINNDFAKRYHGCGEHVWYSFMYYVPENANLDETATIMQFFQRAHDHAGSPNYSLMRYELNGKYYYRLASTQFSLDSDGNMAAQQSILERGNYIEVKPGKWTNIVLHIFVNNKPDAFIEGWIDGSPLIGEDKDIEVYQRKKGDNYNLGAYDTVDGDTLKYKYKIESNRLYGANIQRDDQYGLPLDFGYYRADRYSTTQSVYFDDIKIGKTAQSIGFNHGIPEPVKSNLDVANTNITFDETPKGQSKTDHLIIKNIGDKAVSILDILIADTTNYKINSFPDANLSPGDSTAVEVLFSPQNKNKENSIMVIYTNDAVQDSIAVQLQGKGVYPPELRINIPNRRR